MSPAADSTGAGGGGTTGLSGSASACGAASSIAANTPAATTDSVFVSMKILTDAPSPDAAHDWRYWVLQSEYQKCYTCATCDQEAIAATLIGTRFTSEFL
jgi:hypothetical protein